MHRNVDIIHEGKENFNHYFMKITKQTEIVPKKQKVRLFLEYQDEQLDSVHRTDTCFLCIKYTQKSDHRQMAEL